jgi:hypothetical protein
MRSQIRVGVQSISFPAMPDSPLTAGGFNEKLPHGFGDIDEAARGSSLVGFSAYTALNRFGGNRWSDDGRAFLKRGFVQIRFGG